MVVPLSLSNLVYPQQPSRDMSVERGADADWEVKYIDKTARSRRVRASICDEEPHEQVFTTFAAASFWFALSKHASLITGRLKRPVAPQILFHLSDSPRDGVGIISLRRSQISGPNEFGDHLLGGRRYSWANFINAVS
jgi:hypothetical protein